MADKHACIFCEILDGRSAAAVVYRDEHCIAILDAFPLTRGHLLVIPSQHQQHIEELPAETVAHLFAMGSRFSSALRLGGESEATAVLLNNGKAANQHVAHVHLHVIPRRKGDTALMVWRYLTRFINPWSYIGRNKRLSQQAARWQALIKSAA
ncbi:HIT family protein [Undibacterium sp. TS12]|uniref:HIT family protein n=1 Tax=Undibacterium sp. TS12 TaxID=2908202 RepID=UPI001F4CD9AA|nr:HIT family protein [Undibacterium sp. TS12]